MKNNNCRRGWYMSPLLLLCAVVVVLLLPNVAMGQGGSGANQKRLQIAIPVRNFTEFVSIQTDPTTGQENYGGFAIEVFRAVMNNAIVPSIPFDFIPFAKPDGSMNGTFDDMLKAVASKQYDGAVGEISILYSRTQWVDFTMPYLDTSISMLVRVRQEAVRDSKGISLATITKFVVASSLVFSFIVALVFWILEYKNDKHASSLHAPKFGNSAQSATRSTQDDDWRKEMMGSLIQTRLVTILFFMVLLVLIACYTASQASSIATQRSGSAIKNLNQLIRAGRLDSAKVGYREGSFIRNLLIQKGFLESNLVSLSSEDAMVNMLSKGSKNGGIDALVADTPNLNILQSKHCDKFTIVPTVNLHAEGFGFAFRIGYERLGDVSKGILRIIENGQLGTIQNKTIGRLEACQDGPNGGDGSDLLDSDSLWILIAGAIAVFLLMTVILLLYCGMRCKTRKPKVIAYPCYLSPCC